MPKLLLSLNLTASCGLSTHLPGTLMPFRITALCVFFFSPFLDAILNMVNNIAANVLGGKPDQEGGTETGGTPPSST